MPNSNGLTPEFTRSILDQAIKHAYRMTPVYANGKTNPYASGESYTTMSCYIDAVAIGLILGYDLILVDYDANKAVADASELEYLERAGDQAGIDKMLAAGRTGQILSIPELAAKLGVDVLPPVFQLNEKGDSLHFLFRLPADIAGAELKQSNDGRFAPYVDIKRGNQVCHLKPVKRLPLGLPPKYTIQEAPNSLLESLRTTHHIANRNTLPPAWSGSMQEVAETREMLRFIDPNIGYDAWLKVLMAIYGKFGHTSESVALADDWSKNGNTYNCVSEIEYKFSTFDPFGSVTFATLVHMAKQGGAEISLINRMFNPDGSKKATVEEIHARIDELDTHASSHSIRALLNDVGGFQSIDAAKALQRVKNATGIPLGALKEQLKEIQTEGTAETEDGSLDDLALTQRIIQRVGAENILSQNNSVYVWRNGVWRKQDPVGLNQHIQQFLSNTNVNVNSFKVRSISQLLEAEVFIEGHRFNQAPLDSLNMLNGEIHIVDGKLNLRWHNRAHYSAIQIPHVFDESATAPRFMAFMEEVFSTTPDGLEKSQALLEAFGYTLMNHCRYEKFFICVGGGSNGKSVVLNVLKHILSWRNHCSIQPSKFSNAFNVAQLDGHLANIVSELPAKSILPDDMVKIMASGEPVQVEHKNKDPFTLRSIATTWIATNSLPHTSDVSDALFRRALILEFNNKFNPSDENYDVNLIDKLVAEAGGIIRMSLEAYAEATVSGFTVPASSKAASYAWRENIDQVREFISSEYELCAGERASLADLFNKYKVWHMQEQPSAHPLSRREFSKRIKANGFKQSRDKHGVVFDGLRQMAKEVRPFYANLAEGKSVVALHSLPEQIRVH